MRVGTKQRKRRESNPQGSSLARFRAGCRHPSACPSGIHQAPGEGLEPPRRGRLINSEVRLPFRHPGKGKLCTYEERVDRRRAGHCFCSTFSSLLSPAQFFAALAEKIGVAGLEPAVSCSRSRRISHLSHTPRKCPAGVEPARSPWQGERLPLHHGHCDRRRIVKETQSTGWGSNPRHRLTRAVSCLLDHQCMPRVGPEGLEPSPAWLRARCAAANTLAPTIAKPTVGPGGVEPPSSGYQPSALPLSYRP